MSKNSLKGFSDIYILIIDNDSKILDLLKYMLNSFGFKNIEVALDGTGALRIMRQQKFDFIICDWQMEPMDGIEFVKVLRRDYNSPDEFVPVIMLSGRAEMNNVKIARDAGVTEFIAKPFTVECFRERIVSIVDNPREFVFTDSFAGPTRRRRTLPPPKGKDRRQD